MTGSDQLPTTDSDPERRLCHNDDQCGHRAVCVALNPGQPKRCWCVNYLENPDRDSGECPSVSSDHHQQHPDLSRNGVLYQHHLQDIIFPSDGNSSSPGPANESSSILRLPTIESRMNTIWPHIILPAFGFCLLLFICSFLVMIYRRRFLVKQYSTSRNSEAFLRHNDGGILLDRLSHMTDNPTYFYQNSVLTRRHNIPEVPPEYLKLDDVVGEGAFGQVFKGSLFNPDSATHRSVAVKVLKNGTSREVLEDFEREVEIMSTFDHDNILKLLGIIAQGMDGSPYMIFEYMEYGDLTELLRKNDPTVRCHSVRTIAFSKADLVDVSVQIANGMKYLAAQRFVHRDLATRNCLVGADLVVKISDFGMSRDIYTSDYYRVGGSRLLPVRWMSPEAIKYGRFTCESDIWAYGVVLWEVFSNGKQPYYGHTNEEVIHFVDQGILLQRPEDCPSTVYRVMLGCWKREPKERTAFESLCKYLSDFRNRLSKPVRQQQQACPDLASNGVTTQNSQLNAYIVGLPDKSGATSDLISNQCKANVSSFTQSEKSAEKLNYVRTGNVANEETGYRETRVEIDNLVTTTSCENDTQCKAGSESTYNINNTPSHKMHVNDSLGKREVIPELLTEPVTSND